ncbi:glutathione S-transferase family protein [Tardiphaga sp. 619_E2_N8_5]|jgi:glutathione S-transferase|uniref:glutathione S-transferase family protein n=1 Tax=unclassified Tardiphaga TaxID=2631404 RepID=UPI003F260B23
MIVLHGAGAGFGLPEISPFVTKTEVQLKMAGLPYEKQPARPQDSPKGQMPYIDDGAECIADSTFIRAYIERKYDVDFDRGLDLAQRAQAWAIERMIEHHLYWALVGVRWVDADNFAKGPSHFFDGIPEAQRDEIRASARKSVIQNHLANGLGRHPADEALQLADRSLMALSVLLAGKSHLMSNRPAGVDATAFGVLAGIMSPLFPSPLQRQLHRYGNLVTYVDRMMAEYYPEHAWQCSVAA